MAFPCSNEAYIARLISDEDGLGEGTFSTIGCWTIRPTIEIVGGQN